MNSRLPRLSALLALLAAAALAAPWRRGEAADAGTPADGSARTAGENNEGILRAGPRELSAGDRLILQAVNQLERRASVAARLRHQVAIAGKQLYGAGSYWQQGRGDELRVRLELQVAGQESSLLQVSNSRFLWTDRHLPTGRSVVRIDLRQLRLERVLAVSGGDEPQRAVGDSASVQPELAMYSGGLPALLTTLGQNFSFLPPQAMRLAVAPPVAPQPASIPVFAVVGHWKPQRLAQLTSKRAASKAQQGHTTEPVVPGALPAHVPQEVLLLVGQADLFPYRIEYRRLETPIPPDHEAHSGPYQLSPTPMVVLEISEVAFDVPIAAGQFDYYPADVQWTDQTAAVLERLRRGWLRDVAMQGDGPSGTLPYR